MKIAVLAPFGSHSQESGLLYLLANYLHGTYPEVVQLRCNGMFSVCDRDIDNSWTRSVSSCFACIADQKALSDWSGLPVQNYSSYLLPEDIRDTKQWLSSVSAADLPRAEFRALPVFEVCRESFANRFGTGEYDSRNKNHEQFLRKLMLSAARASLTAQRYQRQYAPDLSLICGGRDFISSSFVTVSQGMQRDVSVLRWNVGNRSIQITHPRQNDGYSCELVPEGVLGMRSDVKTWPRELNGIVQGILEFLGLSAGQLKLPISR